MKVIVRGTRLVAIEELEWFYVDSAAELGLSAQNVEAVHGCGGDMHPRKQHLTAARRQMRVRRALGALTVCQQALLEACYLTRAEPETKKRFEAAAGAVARSLLLDKSLDAMIEEIHNSKTKAHRSKLQTRRRAVEDEISFEAFRAAVRAHEAYAKTRTEQMDSDRDEFNAAVAHGRPAAAVEAARAVEKIPSRVRLEAAKVAQMLIDMGLVEVNDDK